VSTTPAPEDRTSALPEIPTPGFADFVAGGERRKAALAHLRIWLRDRGLHTLFGLLPTAATSWLGGEIGRRIGPRLNPKVEERLRRNLVFIEPRLTPADIDAMMATNREHLGRYFAEFAVAHRFLREGRVTILGAEHLDAAQAQGPVIVVGVHTGNFEVLKAILGRRPGSCGDIYAPPDNPVRHRIAREVRLRLGVDPIAPQPDGAWRAMQRLRAGGTVLIFCDEVAENRVVGPFFGRPPHREGNTSRVVRLARDTGALIVPAQVDRLDGCRFTATFSAPLVLSEGLRGSARLDRDIVILNDVVEAMVRRQLAQWYFLDNRMT
jgi:KDO2-lipid IV(A) lauroyltransferase